MRVEKLARIASERGGVCLSPDWLGYKSKHLWRCAAGHEFEATPQQIPDWVEWCAECRGTGGSLGERLCRLILERMFSISLRRQRPEWLAFGKGGARLELDGYAEPEKIAFEYNGIQHYEARSGLRYNDERVEEQRLRDALKASACRARGVRLVVIPAFKNLSDLSGCIDQLEHCVLWAGLKIPRRWKRPKSLPELYGGLERVFGPATLAKMRQIARDKGGVLVSESTTLARGALDWRCASGHSFRSVAWNVINKGAWCKQCYFETRMVDPAAARVKPWYAVDAGKGDHPERECVRGHKFRLKAKPHHDADWCPICRVEDNIAANKQKAAARCAGFAAERGGVFPKQDYCGGERRHFWVCADGHEFSEYPWRVAKGRWCPYCPKESLAAPQRVCEAMAAE